MRRISRFLLIFLIVLGFLSLSFPKESLALFSHSHTASTITVSYSSISDFGACVPSPNYWLINIGYNNSATQLQSTGHPISETSITSTFNIPNGANINHIEVWASETDSNYDTGCALTVTFSDGGLFSWGTTEPTPTTKEVTVTKVVTPTPTPTPPPDTTPPSVSLTTDFSKPFTSSPKILGKAADEKQVSKIEYSLDNGKNYLPVDSVGTLNKSSTTFSFTPKPLDDGNYSIKIRATDNSDNAGVSKTYTLIIDRLSPQVSGVLYSIGPQVLTPKSDGSIVIISGQKLNVVLSEVGGSTDVRLKIEDLRLKIAKMVALTKNPQNGLWKGSLVFENSGEYQLSFIGVDGAENKTERELNKITVLKKGSVIGVYDAKITVFYQEPKSKFWVLWDGKAFGQKNPLKTDKNGQYSLFLPAGRYYIHIDSYGYQAADTEFFTLDKASPINADFKLNKSKLLFSLGPINLYFPDFSSLSVPFRNNLLKDKSQNLLAKKQLPFFSLSGQEFTSDSLKGKPSVLTFINTWSPTSSEQVSVLDKLAKNKSYNVVLIFEGEKQAKIDIFKKRGGYTVAMISDQDANLSKQLGLSFLPVSYFMDRRGVVVGVVYGSLSEEEIKAQLNF